MILKSITLENIRSYVKETINFDRGVVVLSGDIGAGKSTILLALEFALFGNMESGLLRHGEQDGSVEVTLSINNQDLVIKRFLKRKSEGVRQQSGYLVVNNVKKDLTPVELREHIMTMLNYPKEPTARRSLLYRYTTYTPQDEMKLIMYENADERIATIRKIFGIDKYQRIIENSSLFTRLLREQKKELLGKIADLDQKKNEASKVKEEKIVLTRREKEYEILLAEARKKVAEIQNVLTSLEQELKQYHEQKKEKAILETTIKQKELQRLQLEKELQSLQQEIISSKISPELVSELKQKIKTGLREEIVLLEKESLQSHKQISELETLKKASAEIKKKISELQECPLCLQSVPHTHKEKILSSEETKVNDLEKQLQIIQTKTNELKDKLVKKQNELQESLQSEKELSVLQSQLKGIQEKETRIKERTELITTLVQEVKTLQEKHTAIRLSSFEDKEKELEKRKQELEEARKSERTIELERTKITANIQNTERLEIMLGKEIQEKEKSKASIHEVSLFEQWLQNNFSKIVSLMEKHVLSNVYFTFNDVFKELFGLLIDDERLLARVDETFTPVIEQNGHETEFDFLSGGEKTSVCLAYRLALHKALQGIRTQPSLLILDEPTDGFSSEQIDRMKDLFDKIQASQTIIVSHENKIESIADHVIRIVKDSHKSTVVV